MRSMHSRAYRQFLIRFLEARRRSGLTQQQVARKLKIPQGRVSRMETGERRIDIIELAEFAKLYKRSILFFFPRDV